jgi:glutamyl-tRNA synthetase
MTRRLGRSPTPAEIAAGLGVAEERVLEALAVEKSLGLGKIAQPLRVAVSGGTISPPIDATLALLGRGRTLARLARVLQQP